MNTIFQTTITQIGDCAREALQDDMLITFREGAPADIEEFCFIHQHGNTSGELQPGGGWSWQSNVIQSPPSATSPLKTCVNWATSPYVSTASHRPNSPVRSTYPAPRQRISRWAAR